MCKTAYQLTVSKTVWVEIPEKELSINIDGNMREEFYNKASEQLMAEINKNNGDLRRVFKFNPEGIIQGD